MSDFVSFALVSPALLLIATVLVSSARANTVAVQFRSWVTMLAGVQCLIAVTCATVFATGGLSTINSILLALPVATTVSFAVLYDGVSSLMFALVSFVGWVICRYSIRHLDGESTQGQYFRWTGFTIGSVSLLVISGNLLMFVGFWVMTSLGLHQLLLHYGDRSAAKRAAWTKFTISRLGDAALLAAIVMIYSEFGTFNFAELFAAIASTTDSTSPATNVAALLIVIGAVTKSAQFPFHTWLPLTMETPTPVSALMHAGIVNAGGYLIIRTGPLVSMTPVALTVLAVIGAATACFAATVMLTQTSVKKSLAYSTIAQMGFMMLQCGLGAFSAAMLHILAHSLYKAHAFLSSGSVMDHRASTAGVASNDQPAAWSKLAIVGVGIFACLTMALTIFGINIVEKPGGLLLGGILCLALTQWIGQAMRFGDHAILVRSLLIAGLLCVGYAASFSVVDSIVAESLPRAISFNTIWIPSALVFTSFVCLLVLQSKLATDSPPRWMNAWYVHASNGFYVENLLRRIFGPLSST